MRWLLLLALWVAAPAAAQVPAPRLVTSGGVRALEVDGRPFLMLGGELANSSASTRADMAGKWAKLRAMRLNTVLMPVSWELIEPAEGRFDFAEVDGLLADARAAELRVVLLWFGSWKNSLSSYAPGWVKRDARRFPRARTADGKPIEMLSAFSEANVTADARAYAALMRHLSRTDTRRTVIMVQVENEVGMIPEARDRSPEADAAWARWRGGSEEAFMAHHFARYVERVAAAGKRENPLPTFVNAALSRPGAIAGSGYPAAGPLPHLFDIWRKQAPSIDVIAPDIYFPNFVEWTRQYASAANPLLVPEAGQSGDPATPANALFAFGALDAIGFAPFSIDTIAADRGAELGRLYTLMDGLAPLILARRGTDALWGARPPVAFDGSADLADQSASFGAYRVTLAFTDPWTPADKQRPAEHGAIVLQTGPEELLIAGRGVTATFAPADGTGRSGIEAADEGRVVDGRFVAERRLNGDQTHQGRHVRLAPDGFSVQRVRLYRYR